jgi:hypothetical protein
MRPEYLAEFHAAGVEPYSRGELRDQPETVREPAIQIQHLRTRKVILSRPAQSNADPMASNLAGIAVGLLIVLAIAAFLPVVIFVGMLSFALSLNGGGRRRRRRR